MVLDVQLDGTGKTRVADLDLPVKNKTSRITTTAEGTFRKHAMTEELIQVINSVTANEDCYETIPEDFVREVDYSPDMVKGVADVIRNQIAARSRKMAVPSTAPSTLGGKETREKDPQKNKVVENRITLSGDKAPGIQPDTELRTSEPVAHQWGDSRDIDTANSSRAMDTANSSRAMDIANSGLQSRETDMLESESHKQHEVETTDKMESRDPGAARKLHRSESHGRQTKTTLVSQTTHNDAPTKERVTTEVTPPMRDPITSSGPKRANAGKCITSSVLLAQNKADEY